MAHRLQEQYGLLRMAQVGMRWALFSGPRLRILSADYLPPARDHSVCHWDEAQQNWIWS